MGRDAQEAITCGRALIDALDRCSFPGGARVQVRIGIATGLVVVSTVNRQNNGSDSFAVGAPLHLAARIQAISLPGTVGVDDTSYRLAERNFAFTDFGSHMLKGFAEPTHVLAGRHAARRSSSGSTSGRSACPPSSAGPGK